jgi:sec-independent protein translocase protein TatB
VFGLSFGEMVVCAVIALVVLGPRELPKVMRTMGRTLAKLRRMTTDLRKQSGIDDIIREEGLQEELETLRALRRMSGSGLVESLMENANAPRNTAIIAARAAAAAAAGAAQDAEAAAAPPEPIQLEGTAPDAAAEYPDVGCDAYGATFAVAEAPAEKESA